MNKLDLDYQNLLQDILDTGVRKEDRTGTGTISVFGRTIRHKMSEGFPLLTTKKMYFKGVVTELLWFLRGDTNIKFLVDNDCHIWDGDAYKNYVKKVMEGLKNYDVSPPISAFPDHKEVFINKIKTDDEFAKNWGELGPIYGKQWRSWKSTTLEEQWGYGKIEGHPTGGQQYSKFNTNIHIDQIANLINDLKTNPDSRRLMVSAWNVGEIDQMVLPPCHYGFQVYTRELSLLERYELMKKLDNWVSVHYKEPKTMEYMDSQNIPTRAISLMWNQRSVDTFLGLPFNIASYGLLLEIIAKEVNMVPDELIGNLGDTHLYLNHIEQAKEQIGRELTYDEKVKEARRRFGFDLLEEFRTFDINTKESIEFLQSKQHTREPYPLPKLFFKYEKETYIYNYELDGFILKDYQSHPAIKAPLSN